MKRALDLIVILVGSTILAASCGDRVNDVSLSFYDDGSGPHGFLCTDANQQLLAQRISTEGKLSAVVDLFRLGGSPICSNVAISAWCQAHSCTRLAPSRVCFDLPLTFLESPPRRRAPSGCEAGLAELKGKLVTAEAPAEVVILRVVAIASSCTEVAASSGAFDCTKLVGCTKSCPVFLPEAGNVQLDFDTPGGQCDLGAVVTCAAPDLTETEGACPGAP